MRSTGMICTTLMAIGTPVLSQDAPVMHGITLSGSAQMGIVSGPADDDPTATRTRLLMDFDATVTVARELDNGLTIGVVFDLPEVDDQAPGLSGHRRDIRQARQVGHDTP